MEKVEQRISPAAFDRLRKTMLRAENYGNGPDAVVVIGLASIGLTPRPHVETTIVVDPKLDGPIFPFMDWPDDLAAERNPK